jgi:hypothetical protein
VMVRSVNQSYAGLRVLKLLTESQAAKTRS